jgi:L-alanine-DL-glutamate epimerase and related enzymes of enolase superfamily
VEGGEPEVRTPEQLVAHASELKRRHWLHRPQTQGRGVPPEYELDCYRALAEAFPQDRLRYDPNAALSVEEAVRFGRAIADLSYDYYEDPTWGLNGMRRVRERVAVPLATNTVVVSFEQLAANILQPAVDVVLLDTTFWGGVRACLKAAAVCETFQLSVSVHSSGELGVQLATMLHLGALLPNLVFPADAHYHHLTDDIIVGGKLPYVDGAIAVPAGPGLGVQVDREKLARYADLYREVGGYMYDRDPGRPEWYPLVPNTRWADPSLPGLPLDERVTRP